MFMNISIPELIPVTFYVPTEKEGETVYRPIVVSATYRNYYGFNDAKVTLVNENGEREVHDSYYPEHDEYKGYVEFNFYGEKYQVCVSGEDDSCYSYSISQLQREF